MKLAHVSSDEALEVCKMFKVQLPKGFSEIEVNKENIDFLLMALLAVDDNKKPCIADYFSKNELQDLLLKMNIEFKIFDDKVLLEMLNHTNIQ